MDTLPENNKGHLIKWDEVAPILSELLDVGPGRPRPEFGLIHYALKFLLREGLVQGWCVAGEIPPCLCDISLFYDDRIPPRGLYFRSGQVLNHFRHEKIKTRFPDLFGTLKLAFDQAPDHEGEILDPLLSPDSSLLEKADIHDVAGIRYQSLDHSLW